MGQRLVIEDNQDGREKVAHPLRVTFIEVGPHKRTDDVAHLVQVFLALEVPLGKTTTTECDKEIKHGRKLKSRWQYLGQSNTETSFHSSDHL